MKPFDKLFWGFLFMFDFRLQGFDVLPDIIGYILFYVGLYELARKNKHFTAARQYAIPLIPLSLFDLYQVQRPGFNIDFLSGIFFVIWVVITVLNLLMVYNICTGVAEMARSQGKIKLREDALTRWKYYLWANILFMFSFVAIAIPPLAAIIVLLLLVAFIVVLVLMMMLIKQAGEELSIKELA